MNVSALVIVAGAVIDIVHYRSTPGRPAALPAS
jgi:hypothetical protein